MFWIIIWILNYICDIEFSVKNFDLVAYYFYTSSKIMFMTLRNCRSISSESLGFMVV